VNANGLRSPLPEIAMTYVLVGKMVAAVCKPR
jgi:hypothetical protein